MCASPRRGRAATRGVGATGPRVKVRGLKAAGRRGLTVLEDARPGQRPGRGGGVWGRARRGQGRGGEVGVVGGCDRGRRAAPTGRLGGRDQGAAVLRRVVLLLLGEGGDAGQPLGERVVEDV